MYSTRLPCHLDDRELKKRRKCQFTVNQIAFEHANEQFHISNQELGKCNVFGVVRSNYGAMTLMLII